MPLQTGKNILVAYKEETTFGVQPAVVTGAKQFRLNGSAGLGLRRALIGTNEVRSDGQTGRSRLGSRSVDGSFSADLSQGTFDDLFAAVLRGTWSGGSVIPSNPPLRRSFTFEQYEQDLDITRVFTGCRVSSMTVRLTPDGMAMVEFGIVGANMTILSAASAPLYTSPTLATTSAMVATDAAVSIGGVSTLDFTSCEFTVDLSASTQPVIGSTITPDVFDNNMRISGTITSIRRDAVREQAYLDQTLSALVLALALPSPATGSITFTLPEIMFTDYSASLGDDGAMLATLPFVASKDATKMIQISTAA